MYTVTNCTYVYANARYNFAAFVSMKSNSCSADFKTNVLGSAEQLLLLELNTFITCV